MCNHFQSHLCMKLKSLNDSSVIYAYVLLPRAETKTIRSLQLFWTYVTHRFNCAKCEVTSDERHVRLVTFDVALTTEWAEGRLFPSSLPPLVLCSLLSVSGRRPAKKWADVRGVWCRKRSLIVLPDAVPVDNRKRKTMVTNEVKDWRPRVWWWLKRCEKKAISVVFWLHTSTLHSGLTLSIYIDTFCINLFNAASFCRRRITKQFVIYLLFTLFRT